MFTCGLTEHQKEGTKRISQVEARVCKRKELLRGVDQHREPEQTRNLDGWRSRVSARPLR